MDPPPPKVPRPNPAEEEDDEEVAVEDSDVEMDSDLEEDEDEVIIVSSQNQGIVAQTTNATADPVSENEDTDEALLVDSDDNDDDDLAFADVEVRSTASEGGIVITSTPRSIPLPPGTGVGVGGASSNSTVWSTVTPPSLLAAGSLRRSSRNQLNKTLRVFSIDMLPNKPRPEMENGGKMLLPPSILASLTHPSVQLKGVMLFRVSNLATNQLTHCGVLEFTAEEGRCYMPAWRMRNIGANEGDLVTVQLITAEVEVGTFVIFEPQSVDFLDVTNPKALLENTLRNFACLTKGEIIVLRYNNRIYELKVLDTKPTDAINIVECNISVDFAPAVGLPPENPAQEEEEMIEDTTDFVPFQGAGATLKGKPVVQTPSTAVRRAARRGVPDFDWRPGQLKFNRKARPGSAAGPQTHQAPQKPPDDFTAFTGSGSTLGR